MASMVNPKQSALDFFKTGYGILNRKAGISAWPGGEPLNLPMGALSTASIGKRLLQRNKPLPCFAGRLIGRGRGSIRPIHCRTRILSAYLGKTTVFDRDFRGGIIPEYRTYIIGNDGHFLEAVPLVCADDAEATEKAKRLVDGHDVELWQRDRKIAALHHKPKAQF
jgi:hypothetical protein